LGTRTGHSDGREREAGTLLVARRGVLRDYVETIVVCVIFVLFARAFVFQQSEIPSGSMEDTILVGDYVLVNRFLYAPATFDWEPGLVPSRQPRRGDVVVFKHPKEPEQDFIKRIVGLPQETVELRDGRVFVDGRPLAEPYLNPLYDGRDDFGPLVVAPEHYFLLGDHRNRSSDSRTWGLVPRELLKGRAFVVALSTSGASSPDDVPGRVTATSLGRKIYNLVFHSRWGRCLTVIR
jgi:signal peptidase I